MTTPASNGATAGQPPLANQINQFLGVHQSNYLYTGTQQGGQTTLGSGGTNSNGLYLAQSFTAGSTFNLGRVILDFSTITGTPTAPTTISIQTSSGGAPSGTSLVTSTVPPSFLTGFVSLPVPCSLTSATGYWIVIAAVGDASDFVTWLKSNQTSGASTSTNGSTWTAQTYGFYYSYWDQSVVPPLIHTRDDSGAGWTTLGSYNSFAQPTTIQEFTTAQGTNQYVSSNRTITYSSSILASTQ